MTPDFLLGVISGLALALRVIGGWVLGYLVVHLSPARRESDREVEE